MKATQGFCCSCLLVGFRTAFAKGILILLWSFVAKRTGSESVCAMLILLSKMYVTQNAKGLVCAIAMKIA